MADRSEVIEVGKRDRRRPIGLLVVLVVLGVSVAGLIASRGADEPAAEREPVPASPSPTPVRSLTRAEGHPDNVLHPETAGKGDVARMRVVFPDGVRATVRYPAELRLDRLGVRPVQGVFVDGHFRQLVAPFGGELESTRGGEPIRSFADNVTLWPSGNGSGQVLLFAFGPWRMAVHDQPPGLPFDQRVALAEGLRGRVDADGFLVLSGSERVRLAEPGEMEQGVNVGAQLLFGDGVGEMVALIPTPGCTGLPKSARGRGDPFREVCRDGMRVVVTGDEDFIGKALDGIRISVK